MKFYLCYLFLQRIYMNWVVERPFPRPNFWEVKFYVW